MVAGMSRFRASLLTMIAMLPLPAAAAEPLSSVGAVRTLPAEEAAKGLPVRLEAVVSCYHPGWGVLLVHDGRDGICVGVPEHLRPAKPFSAGQRLSIAGGTGPGEFLPVILPTHLEQTMADEPLNYEKLTAEQLFAPGADCHPVEIEAVVKGTWYGEKSLVVDLQMEGWPLKAVLPQEVEGTRLPWQFLEQRVRVRGVAGTHFNDQRQMSGRLLYVQGLSFLTLAEEAEAAGEAPLVPVDGLLRVDSSLRQRIRVRGVVTHVISGRGLYLRGEGGGLFVQTAQPLEMRGGDVVEAEGYPVITPFRPSLSAVNVSHLETTAQPEPVPFDAAATRHSREQCELVWLEAELLEATRDGNGSSFACRAAGKVFDARLPGMLDLEPGSKLRLTGICEMLSTHPLVIPRNATAFRILLRSPADVVVAARPPWWSGSRGLWALGGLASLAVIIGAWAVGLQFLVRRQSSVIRHQARQQATLEERQRIARDLHDTLEQELVGVTMLLDSAARKLPHSQSEAAEPLGLALRLLRRAREESRSTIREMRSVTLEQRGLPAALEELLRPLATVGGAAFQVQTTGRPARLPGAVETHLLRIAQEAVANATQHARPRQIDIRIDYDPAEVCLQIRDDGIGFDPAAPVSPGGHFGLQGMRERAGKISARLEILSEPGAGTSVKVTVPQRPTSHA
jgi:signal transduction histidine kinase